MYFDLIVIVSIIYNGLSTFLQTIISHFHNYVYAERGCFSSVPLMFTWSDIERDMFTLAFGVVTNDERC